MEKDVYEKVGRRYVRLGTNFTGFPSDGLWYVADGRNSLIMKAGEIPDPMPLAQLERYRGAACEEMNAILADVCAGKSYTTNDLVTRLFKAVAADANDQERSEAVRKRREQRW